MLGNTAYKSTLNLSGLTVVVLLILKEITTA